ncbi:MAG: hypothetical protein QF464_11120, partial [Myxococcota bacterium]|nr:hypothetical protein [Myxococcota bacterium]
MLRLSTRWLSTLALVTWCATPVSAAPTIPEAVPACFEGQGEAIGAVAGALPKALKREAGEVRCASLVELDGKKRPEMVVRIVDDGGQFTSEAWLVLAGRGKRWKVKGRFVPPNGDMAQTTRVEVVHPGDGIPYGFLAHLSDQSSGAVGVEVFAPDKRAFVSVGRAWGQGCLEDTASDREPVCTRCGIDPSHMPETTFETSGVGDDFRVVRRTFFVDPCWCTVRYSIAAHRM